MYKDYVLLIDKPAFMTSHDCLSLIKNKLKVNKIGHTGTLDPLATGLMVVLVNEATKLSNFILSQDKTYEATMQLFIKTDTGDISGQVIHEARQTKITITDVVNVINEFDNITYLQRVPVYSAIKINGQKLYQYARKQTPIELPTREVTIKSLRLISYEADLIKFEVTCSKGTYIRSLVQDLSEKLKTVGTLVNLRRTGQTGFKLKNALPLDQISAKTVIDQKISIVDALKPFLPVLTISDETILKKIKHGQSFTLFAAKLAPTILLVNQAKQPLAIYQQISDHHYHCQRGFRFNENYETK